METKEINELGKKLELYTTVDYIGKGFPIFLPRCSKMLKTIIDYIESEEEKQGYEIVRTPSVSNSDIFKIEDRYTQEKDSLFIIEDQDNNPMVLKPYVQPFHCSIFKVNQHSYKELPIKYGETSIVYRNEMNIKGISKTRQITMSDASIFADPDKVEKEIAEILKFQSELIAKLGLDVKYEVCNWDTSKKQDYIGTIDEWNCLTQAMKNALKSLNLEYTETTRSRMYGPRIRIVYNGKSFSSIQVDFEITHRFDLKYKDKDNKDKFPIYIHGTLLGSYENLIGILIEKYKGDFPFWITPEQIYIIPSSAEYEDYADEIKKVFDENNLRAKVNKSFDSLQAKIDYAKSLKIPYIVVVDKQQMNKNCIKAISIEYEKNMKIEDFVKEVTK